MKFIIKKQYTPLNSWVRVKVRGSEGVELGLELEFRNKVRGIRV